MHTPDVMAAAELLRRVKGGEDKEFIYDKMVAVYDGCRVLEGDTLGKLAIDDAIVTNAVLPWFDQTPITGEWLESIGGHKSKYTDRWDFCGKFGVGTNDRGHWMLWHDWQCWIQVRRVTTRGQLLQLLAALGIEVKT